MSIDQECLEPVLPSPNTNSMFRYLRSACWSLGCALPVAIWASIEFGSVQNAVLFLNGHAYRIGQPYLVNEKLTGGKVAIHVPVRNLCRNSLFVVGVESSCTCVKPIELPLLIPSRETRDVVLALGSADSSDGQYVVLLFDSDGTRRTTSIPLSLR